MVQGSQGGALLRDQAVGTSGATEYMDGVGSGSGGRRDASGDGAHGEDVRQDVRWQENLIKRLSGLKPGFRYTITFTVGHSDCDWTVDEGLKVERPKK